MTDTPFLLPCPFCRAPAGLVIETETDPPVGTETKTFSLRCSAAGCVLSLTVGGNPIGFLPEAVRKWNTRADLTAADYGHCPDATVFRTCVRCGLGPIAQVREVCDRSRIADRTETCCECGGEYPLADFLRGYIFCVTCRARDRVAGQPITSEDVV